MPALWRHLAAGSSTNREFNQDGDIWSTICPGNLVIADDMRLTLGGRYTEENKDADRFSSMSPAKAHPLAANIPQSGIATDPYNLLYGIFAIEPYEQITGKSDDDSSFTPVVTLEWDVSEDTMAYATWTKGISQVVSMLVQMVIQMPRRQ